MKPFSLIFFASWLISASAFAQNPTAIIEEITASKPDVEKLDIANAGQIIELGETGKLVIGYLRSCVREQIDGGTVTVGVDRSIVKGGRVSRERVECDGGRLLLTLQQSLSGSTFLIRKPPGGSVRSMVTVQSTSPIIIPPHGARTLVIERLDGSYKIQKFDLVGRYLDLASVGVALIAGGLYRAVAGAHETIFDVGQRARVGAGPVISRLVIF